MQANSIANVYLGLTDRVTEDTWLWLDGTPYTPDPILQLAGWFTNQPDNSKTFSVEGEDCALMDLFGTATDLFDAVCDLDKRHGLCMRPIYA